MNLYCFDFFGVPVGYVDDNGGLFDSHGVRWAQLHGGHDVYDLEGRYRGRIGPQGSFYPVSGVCVWYVRGWDWSAPPQAVAAVRDVGVRPHAPTNRPATSRALVWPRTGRPVR